MFAILSLVLSIGGVVQVGQVPGFGIFLKSASRLLPDGWVGRNSFGKRYHFWAFQLELDILGTKNFGIGPVIKKLQPFEVGWFLENPEMPRLCRRKSRKNQDKMSKKSPNISLKKWYFPNFAMMTGGINSRTWRGVRQNRLNGNNLCIFPIR